MNMTRRNIEDLGYVVLGLLIVAQCTVGSNFWLGQALYLCANLISLFRCFALCRPMGDKIKDVCCTAITIGLIIFNILK